MYSVSARCFENIVFFNIYSIFCYLYYNMLSGEVNPHGKWRQFNSVREADGLRVDDIIRVE